MTPSSRRAALVAAAFLLALGAFGYRLERAGIAGGYVDPVGRIAAQDEATYSHTALRMARDGKWLAPRFLGRLALYKPPMVFWLPAASVRALGASRAALRLPALLAGAAAAAILFAWVLGAAGLLPAIAAWLLFVSDPIAHRLARMNLTDTLLLVFIAGAMAVLARDPGMAKRWSAPAFGALAGLAILTKGIAGLLAPISLVLYRMAAPRGKRPPLMRLAEVSAAGALVALPWHLYQLAAHTQWFWAEYVRDEIVFWGTGAPPQTSAEPQAWFYLRRLWGIDPFLCLAAAAAAPWFAAAAWRGRDARARIAAAWLAASAAALLGFQYRNAAYLLALVPPLALLAVAWTPLARGRVGMAAVAALAVLFVIKADRADAAWGLPYGNGFDVPSGPALRAYCERGRDRDLIVLHPNDEFLSAVLPLARVRYLYIVPGGYRDPRALDFRALGIVVTAQEFLARQAGNRMLEEWNGDTAPWGTTIIAASSQEVERVVAASPGADFFLPEGLAPAQTPGHERFPAPPGRVFLLSRQAGRTAEAVSGCGL